MKYNSKFAFLYNIFFFAQIIFLSSVYSQTSYTGYIPFPEDSAQWSVWYTDQTSITSVQYRMKGDTIINGINYNRIYKSRYLNYGTQDTILNCFIRQDTSQKKVFCRYPYNIYNDSSEFILYDFSLTTGDTFFIKILPDQIMYPIAIVSDDTGQVTSNYRRVLSLHVVDTCGLPYCLWGIGMDNSDAWVEGMGSLVNLLYCEIPKNCCFMSTFNTQCFWQEGQYFYGGTFCDYHTSIVSMDKQEIFSFTVSPNPSNSFITLNIEINNIKSIVIYDFTGRAFIPDMLIDNDLSESKINVSNLENGLYFIQIIDYSGINRKAKFCICK